MFKIISKKEWLFLGIMWVITAIIIFIPLLVGYSMTPPGSDFLFRPNGYADNMVYLSQIEQAKRGVFFFKDFFTSEPQAFGVANLVWYAIGVFARIFHLSSFIAFHVARFFLIPICLVSGYYLISFFFKEPSKRKICFIFFIFASGMGGWIKAFLNLQGSNILLPSVDFGEDFSFTLFYSFPHFIASFTLIILFFLFSLYFFENRKFIYSVLAGLCACLLFSFHPYHVYTIVFVSLAFVMVGCLMERKINIDYIKHYAIVLFFSAPPMLYHLWVFSNIPVRYQTMLLNVTPSPPLQVVLADYSVLLILAVFGGLALIKLEPLKKRNIFLIVWVVTQFFLVYLPIKTQRRLFEGLNVPIIILAVQGLFFLNDRLKLTEWLRRKLSSKSMPFFSTTFPILGRFFGKILLLYAFVLLFGVSNISFYVAQLEPLINKEATTRDLEKKKHLLEQQGYNVANWDCYGGHVECYGPYIAKDSVNAMVWLKENTPEQSVIFSRYLNGDIIPVIAYRPVYFGHWGETAKFQEKRIMVESFFETYDRQQRKAFLEGNNINYMFWGPQEKSIAGDFDPGKENFLQKVYGNNSVSIYKVN